MRRQSGFALLELVVAMLIAMLATVFAADRLAQRGRDVAAENHAVWMAALHHAALRYIEAHGPSLATDGSEVSIDGFSHPLTPTSAELKNAGLLAAGHPSHGSKGVGAKVQLLRQGNCPSDTCRIEALVYSDAPIGRSRSHPYDLSMVAHWLGASRGRGGAVMPARNHLIAGAAFSFPNPPEPSMAALPPGTVALAVTVDQLAELAYLRVRDQRNPDFQGAVTAAGDLRTQGSLHAADHLFIDGQAYGQAPCTLEGAIVREHYGGLLVCRSGRWRSAGGAGGGGYSTNSVSGCVPAAANPVTGDCSCPSHYVPVRIADSTSAVLSEGRTRGYLCVG